MLGGHLLETENKRKCQKWSRSLKKFEKRSLTREFLKQYLTEKQNGRHERVNCFAGVLAFSSPWIRLGISNIHLNFLW